MGTEHKNNATVSSCVSDEPSFLIPLLTTIDYVIALAAIIGNSIVIWSVGRFPALRTITNLFVVSLAVADLLVGVCIPYYVLFYYNDLSWVCNYFACLVRYFTVLYTTVSSMLSNIGVAVDRYVAIVHPLSYRRIMGTGWVMKSIIFGWIYVGIITALPLMGVNRWNEEQQQKCKEHRIECDLRYIASETYALLAVGFHVLLTLVVTMVLYFRIFREAWRQLRAVATLEANPRIHGETKTAKMMVLVLGVCLLGLTPYLVAILLPYTDNSTSEDDCDPEWSLYKKCAVSFYLGKSSANPLIYGWKNRDFREAFLRLLKINKKRHFDGGRSTKSAQRSHLSFTITTGNVNGEFRQNTAIS